jgi:hypothetical protein
LRYDIIPQEASKIEALSFVVQIGPFVAIRLIERIGRYVFTLGK